MLDMSDEKLDKWLAGYLLRECTQAVLGQRPPDLDWDDLTTEPIEPTAESEAQFIATSVAVRKREI